MNYLIAVLNIAIIDLVLSGDNAAVIGLAIRNLPRKQHKPAAILGTAGAIILRIFFTALATYLTKIPYLYAIGGVILIWITWKLLQFDESEDDGSNSVRCSQRFWDAIGAIIIADLSMAFDNILGVAAAAHGEIPLVIFGLALSIPILVIGSTWLANMMNRFPIIIYLGGAILLRTSLEMIFKDPALQITQYTGPILENLILWGAPIVIMIIGAIQTIPVFGLAKHAAATDEKEPDEPNKKSDK